MDVCAHALAEPFHHSSGPTTKKVVERREEHSGVDGLPTFALPVLAGSPGEAIDSGTLSFLLEQLAPRIVEEEEEEELKLEQVLESAVWVQFRDKAGNFWNRRTHETVWRAPADVDVVWVAKEDKRGSSTTGTGSPMSARMTFLLFFLAEGRRQVQRRFRSTRCVPFGCRQAQVP